MHLYKAGYRGGALLIVAKDEADVHRKAAKARPPRKILRIEKLKPKSSKTVRVAKPGTRSVGEKPVA